jgi:hypothetical protein
MIHHWQEILTLGIVAVAVWWLLRKYFFKSKPVKGAGDATCAPCSTGSCDSCAVMDLKKEIEAAKAGKGQKLHQQSSSEKKEKWQQKLEHEIHLREKKLK